MQRTPRAAASRQQKNPTPHHIKLANSTIISLSGLLVASLVTAGVQQVSTAERNQKLVAEYTPVDFAEPTSTPRPVVTTDTPVSESVDRLNNRDEPWAMTVLGDSTGNEPTEWVQLTIKRLAAVTGRPAEIHTWNLEAEEYEAPIKIAGDGEPIVVWNGSASGRKASYSLEHIETMAPEPVDLVVINHGHNQKMPTRR